MDYRPFGRTGVKVSPLCLGAMMFGAWGNPDHDESIRIIHRALDAGINFIDTADVYSRGRIRGDRRQGARGPPRRRRARDEGPRHDGRRSQRGRQLAALDHRRRCENSLRRLGTDWIDLYQIHRSDPRTDHEETLGALTDLVRAGQGPLHRLLDVSRPAQIVKAQWVARAARPRTASSASSRRTRSSCAASRPTCCRVCERYGMGVIPWSPLAGGWLSRPLAQGPATRRRARAPAHPAALRPLDPGEPAEARRGRRTRAAGRGGGHLAHPPGARVRDRSIRRSPRRSSARARWSSSKSSSAPSTSTLDAALLDRIDEIVPPGTTSTRADAGWTPPAVADASRRRR